MTFLARFGCMVGVTAWCLAAGAVTGFAQEPRGGEIELRAIASGEERSAQSDLYVMDVWYKPMRMITVELTDLKTGQKKPEYVCYIVYRAFNRKLAKPTSDERPTPENVFDPEVITPPLFVPEFTLQTDDTTSPKIYADSIIPEALPIIQKREKGKYLTSVDIVGAIPPATEPGAADREGVWGVAMWRGIDPKADRYTIYLTGFSNGIRKINGPDGEPVIQTKTITMKYWRPGDEFDQAEPEIRAVGPAQWIYR